ncbi:DUF2783 domain-containing protein [Acidovorax sp. LjRoot118]|uniref:DUF2783 domain-containing protein n=1 Tax=unclassified Acidovorax TaxID=2684926 RepID=UPI000A58820A|nr:DUF2783 domain-containing protein [Acidovorax sp. Root219]
MLDTQPHMQDCDDFYESLIASHNGLTPPESHAMNARLILLLANHIGDQATLLQALQLARGTTVPTGAADMAPVTPVAPVHAAA